MKTFNNRVLATAALLAAAIFVLAPAQTFAQDIFLDFDQKKAAPVKKKATTKEGEKEKDQRQIERDQWTIYYAQQIPKYTFHLESNKDEALKVNPEAKLRYWNPIRIGNNHGELFIWTHKGRAVLAGSILSYELDAEQRRVAHEFHSFSQEKITGVRGSTKIEMSAPGVKFKPISDAPKPGKSRAQRMVQLRRLAKSFDATTLLNNETTQPLRPLSQPIYRYETKEINEDGAIFAYVTGTDPELLVAIETRQTKDGVQWHFAAGRFSDLPITLNYKKEAVWKFNEEDSYVGGYTVQHGIDFQPYMPEVEVEAKSSTEKAEKAKKEDK